MPKKKEGDVLGYTLVNLCGGMTLCDMESQVYRTYSQAKWWRDWLRKDCRNPDIVVVVVREIEGER